MNHPECWIIKANFLIENHSNALHRPRFNHFVVGPLNAPGPDLQSGPGKLDRYAVVLKEMSFYSSRGVFLHPIRDIKFGEIHVLYQISFLSTHRFAEGFYSPPFHGQELGIPIQGHQNSNHPPYRLYA